MQSPLLISNKENIFYLTGFLPAYNREVFVLFSDKEKLFITDARIINLVDTKIKRIKEFKIVERNHSYTLLHILTDFLKKHTYKKLFFEKKDITVSEYEEFSKKLKDITLVGTKDIVEKKREIKQKREIDSIQKAADITDKAFKEILPIIKPKTEEREIAWKIKSALNKYGADPAFEPIVASGKGSSIPHYISQNKEIGNNTLLLLDFGARFNGYCSDMTRVLAVGTISAQMQHIYSSVLNAQLKTLSYLNSQWSKKKNIQAKAVDLIARESIIKDNFPSIPHGVGHGVGINIHENPRINPKSTDNLEKGMVITIEPGIYIPNLLGIRIEDLVLIDKKITVMSKSTKQLIKIG